MPYPNFHSCRLIDPGAFEKGTFVYKNSGTVGLVLAKRPGSSELEVQAIRYPFKSWDEKKARAS